MNSAGYPTFSTPVAAPLAQTNWAGLVMSADGSRIFALYIPNSSSSKIPILYSGYCSDQTGSLWRWNSFTLASYSGTYVASYSNPPALAASSDCRVMCYVVYSIAMYLSTDFGVTWSVLPFPLLNPTSVSVSPNGNKITIICFPYLSFTLYTYISYSPVTTTSTTSSQYSLLAYGGGKGGNRDNGYNEGGFGFGSGGGAGSVYYLSSTIATYFSSGGTPGYNVGNYGGFAYNSTYYAGGGGGGAGNTGSGPTGATTTTKGGAGGTGASWWLNSTFYGGGGGGGGVVVGCTGGAGTYLWGGGGSGGTPSSSSITYGGPGLPNTGGGGGGGSGSLITNAGGNGGSGVIILALKNT